MFGGFERKLRFAVATEKKKYPRVESLTFWDIFYSKQISYVNFVTVTICYDQSIDHGQKWILLCQTNLTIHIVWSLRKYFSWIQIWLTAKAFISIGHVVIRIFCWMFLDNISKYAHNRCKTISLKLANMAEIVDVPH